MQRRAFRDSRYGCWGRHSDASCLLKGSEGVYDEGRRESRDGGKREVGEGGVVAPWSLYTTSALDVNVDGRVFGAGMLVTKTGDKPRTTQFVRSE